MTAQCVRCSTILRRTSNHRPDHLIALTATAFILLIIMCSTQLMSVDKAGIYHVADLFSGPQELVRQDMAPLAAVVIFVTVLAPFARLIGTLYVLIRSQEAVPPRHLRRVFALAEKLRPWSMIDVFVFGVFVAYVKLGALVTIGLATGVYALLGLTFVLVWMVARPRGRLGEARPPRRRRPGSALSETVFGSLATGECRTGSRTCESALK